jgi:gliding motility-associated-like protein
VILHVVGCKGQSVYVPNTFTPNNDGLNDRLYVRGNGLSQLEYFRIFDRWGRMVFQTQNIAEGWDGTTGGKPDDINTYVYVLKAVCSSGEEVSLQGNVTLLR